jgi:hypothetical protein
VGVASADAALAMVPNIVVPDAVVVDADLERSSALVLELRDRPAMPIVALTSKA